MAEWFDFLNVPSADLAERKKMYGSLGRITNEMKKMRRENLRLHRQKTNQGFEGTDMITQQQMDIAQTQYDAMEPPDYWLEGCDNGKHDWVTRSDGLGNLSSKCRICGMEERD